MVTVSESERRISMATYDDFKKIELFTNEKQEILYKDKILRTEKSVITTDKNVQKGSKIS